MMRRIGPLIYRLKVGRWLDWWYFNKAKWRSAGTIEYAELPHVDPPFRLRMGVGSKLVIGRNVRFRPGFSADIEGTGVLEIGDNTAFNMNCWVGVTTRISIGEACLIGPLVSFTDGNHRFDDPDELIWHQGVETREIEVGRNVWIGAKATIINNVGDNAVIGANAVVAKPVPANGVAMGVPARVVRYRGDERGA